MIVAFSVAHEKLGLSAGWTSWIIKPAEAQFFTPQRHVGIDDPSVNPQLIGMGFEKFVPLLKGKNGSLGVPQLAGRNNDLLKRYYLACGKIARWGKLVRPFQQGRCDCDPGSTLVPYRNFSRS